MKEIVHWPAWKHGPNGQKQVFHSPEEVPVGWFSSREEADAHDAASVVPPQNGTDYWEGYSKQILIQMLRKAGHKVNANMSVRKAFEKCEELNLLDGGEDGEEAGTVL